MADFINGWQNPVFKIYDENVLVEIINLPITGASGLVESTQELKTSHRLLNYSTVEDIYGYWITWTLPYSEYANKDTMLKIQKIMKYRKSGFRIYLIPRSDDATRGFWVVYTGDSLDFGIKRGGASAIGNRLVTIEFRTKDLIENLNWTDPNAKRYGCWYQHNRLAVQYVPPP